jgi:type I restriction enzyme S subunit
MTQAWESVRLGQVLKQVSRGESVQATKEYKLLGVRLDAGGAFHRETKLGSESSANTLYQVREGDFIYSRLFAWRGAFDLISQELDGCFVSNEFPIFHARDELIDSHFLNFWFQLSSTLKAVEADCTGSTPLTRNRFKESFFLALQIPLPPLEEQRRIVARVESLAAQIAEARGLREDNMKASKNLQLSSQKAVFEHEKIALMSFVRLGDIADIRAGVTLGRSLNGLTVNVPYLRVANVQDGFFKLSEIKTVAVFEHEVAKWRLQKGDILLTEGGDWDKLGRGAVWNDEIPNCIHQNHIFRLRVNPLEFLPEFLASYIGSPIGKTYFQLSSKQTTNLASINQKQLKDFLIPQLTIEQQADCLEEISRVKSQISALEQLQEATRLELEALLPSVLSKAFAGEL